MLRTYFSFSPGDEPVGTHAHEIGSHPSQGVVFLPENPEFLGLDRIIGARLKQTCVFVARENFES